MVKENFDKNPKNQMLREEPLVVESFHCFFDNVTVVSNLCELLAVRR